MILKKQSNIQIFKIKINENENGNEEEEEEEEEEKKKKKKKKKKSLCVEHTLATEPCGCMVQRCAPAVSTPPRMRAALTWPM